MNSFYCANSPPVTLEPFPYGGNLTGPGISGFTFIPALVSAENVTIRYVITGSCPVNLNYTVAIGPETSVNLNGFANQTTFCQTDPIQTLTVNPFYGVISGEGIQVITQSGTVYNSSIVAQNDIIQWNPASVPEGIYTISYSFQDKYGCTFSDIDTITVYDNTPLSITGLSASYCISHRTVYFFLSNPSGVVSGPGIRQTLGSTLASFSPSLAGTGTFFINYTFTPDPLCKAPVIFQVTVNPLPTITNLASSSPNNEVCLNSSPLQLMASPTGGTFSGPGVSNGMFFPNQSGPGSQLIEYFYINQTTQCNIIDSFVIDVLPIPFLEVFNLDPIVCMGQYVSIVTNRFGGTFEGTGIFGQDSGRAYFNSTLAGNGTHDFSFFFTDLNGCSNNLTFTFYVYSEIEFTIPTKPNNLICTNDGVLPITLFPSGGQLTINTTGLISNSNGTFSFDSSIAEEGNFTFNYTITSNNGGNCPTSYFLDVEIYRPPMPTISGISTNSSICFNSDPISLVGSPQGGTFTGPGINGNTFSPSAAGNGQITIRYELLLGNGCMAFTEVTFQVYFTPTCTPPIQPLLSNEAIAGIVVGAFCVFVIIIVAIIFYAHKKIKKTVALELKEIIMTSQFGSGVVLSDEDAEKYQFDPKWNIDPSELDVEKEIGRGAFGAVFKAKWRGKDVAVKKVHPEEFTESNLEEFAKEVKVMQNLRPHPNVVGLLGIVKSPLSLVTTFYVNGSLYVRLRREPFEIDQILKILLDIASGMVIHFSNMIEKFLKKLQK